MKIKVFSCFLYGGSLQKKKEGKCMVRLEINCFDKFSVSHSAFVLGGREKFCRQRISSSKLVLKYP
jgi:hypothetical protein